MSKSFKSSVLVSFVKQDFLSLRFIHAMTTKKLLLASYFLKLHRAENNIKWGLIDEEEKKASRVTMEAI